MAPGKRIDIDQILDIAIRLANEQGMDAVTLASVAQQLNIRIPSLYNHVSGLPGLRYAMRLRGVQQLADQMQRAAVGKAGADAILSISHAYRAFARSNPGIYPATIRAASPEEPEVQQISQQLIDVIMAVFAPYGFSPEETLHKIRAFRSVLHGFVGLEIEGGFGMALDCDESFQQLLDLLIRGLAGVPPNT